MALSRLPGKVARLCEAEEGDTRTVCSERAKWALSVVLASPAAKLCQRHMEELCTVAEWSEIGGERGFLSTAVALKDGRMISRATAYCLTDERVVVTMPIVGITRMQVCAIKDATDDEILAVANTENPSGTELGWTRVVRDAAEPGAPVVCAENPARLHFLVVC